MKNERFFLSREALYIKIWETPTVKIAEEFGISDVAIGKMCRKLEVPKPPRGYWARVQAGAKKSIPALRKAKEETPPGIWIYPASEQATLGVEDDGDERPATTATRDLEAIIASDLPVFNPSKQLRNPHAMVAATRERFKSKSVNYGDLGTYRSPPPVLDIKVSHGQLGRALRFFDALIKELEGLGCKVSIGADQQQRTEISFRNTSVSISLSEKYKRFENLPDEKQKGRFYERYRFEPSGVFAFTISGGLSARSNWIDGKTASLEDQFRDILVGILHAINVNQHFELKRKIEEKRNLEIKLQNERKRVMAQRAATHCSRLKEIGDLIESSKKVEDFARNFDSIAARYGLDQEKEDEQRFEEFRSWLADGNAGLDLLIKTKIQELAKLVSTRDDEPRDDESQEYRWWSQKLKSLEV